MGKLLKSLAAQRDLWFKRYQAFVVTEESDKEACIAVLEEVRRKELNRVAGKSVLDSHSFSGEKVDYELTAVRDTKSGQVVGCMRLTPAKGAKEIQSSREEYHLDLFDEIMLNQMIIFTRLAIIKSYRKTPAALVLISHSFAHVLENGNQGVLMSCEPNLFPMYKSLGLRPIGSLHNSPSGGYRIPMICLPDKEYFNSIGSPAMSLLKNVDFDRYENIRNWYQDFINAQGEIQVGISYFDAQGQSKTGHQIITEGLSEKGRASFLKNAMNVKCARNDVIVAEKDGGKSIGVVRRGFVEVIIDGKTVGILGQGDLFGEIAFVLNINRTAKLVAGTDNTEVVLYSVSAFKRLEKTADQIAIWQNLARILANRILQKDEFTLADWETAS